MDLATKVSPTHTALVVIDIQRDFAAPDGALAKRGRDTSTASTAITNIQSLLINAEQQGVETYYFKQVYDRTKLNPLQLEQYDLDGKVVTCDIDTNGHEFYRLTPPADKVYVKYNYNIFSNPAFVQSLQTKGIKTLILVGMDTQYCVETAIRHGFDLGYKIVVPVDCVACSAKQQDAHNRTLALTEKVFGTLTTAAELATLWQRQKAA